MGLWDTLYNNIKKQLKPQLEAKNKIPNGCVEIDSFIKKLDIEISDLRRKEVNEGNKAKEFGFRASAEILSDIRSQAQKLFISKKCATQIENIKAKETAGIIGNEITKYEDDVLRDSDKERKQLFIIGGAVLLVALGMILVLNKKKK